MKLAGTTFKTKGGNSFPQHVIQQTGTLSQELQVLKRYMTYENVTT